MSEGEFIELAVRYLDGAADHDQAKQLSGAMLDQPENRRLYRDLAQQMQWGHELLHQVPSDRVPAGKDRHILLRPALIVASLAAAAALVLLVGILFEEEDPLPVENTAENERSRTWKEIFETTAPNWSDIYKSPFDYPNFVWDSEIAEHDQMDSRSFDEFSDDSAQLLLAAAGQMSDFSRRLESIVLLPMGEDFGSRLY